MIHRPTSINEVANLALCHTVSLNDIWQTEIEIVGWCWQNNLSLVKHDCIDISDFSLEVDTVSTFWFLEEKDAMLFKLRWEK